MLRIPISKIFTPLLLVMLLVSGEIDLHAQRRGTRRGRARTSQPQVKAPLPTLPRKSETELRFEREVASVSAFSADTKEAARAALEGLNRLLRVRRLRGYYKHYLISEDTEQVQKLIQQVEQKMPQQSVLRLLIVEVWNGLADAHLAETYYRGNFNDDKLLQIVDRYKLGDMPASLIGDKVISITADRLLLALDIARKAGIMQTSEQ